MLLSLTLESVTKDNIYALPLDRVGDFSFDQRVVNVFPDMISRSVPGYGSILSMIGELSAAYASSGTNIYDLGCSLGAATRLIHSRVPSDCVIHAVDSSPAMITRLREIADAEMAEGCRVEVNEADLTSIPIENTSFVVLNFTLQFIPAANRESLLKTIYDGLNPGGALVLSEKVCFDDPNEQLRMTEMHEAFKRANGYSELEIAQKRNSLEKTLIPETVAAHRQRLSTVGFDTIVQWFQCFNFTSILAVK